MFKKNSKVKTPEKVIDIEGLTRGDELWLIQKWYMQLKLLILLIFWRGS